MSKQISIRWDSGNGTDYEASVQALRAYTPRPDITASVRLKGSMAQDTIQALVELAAAHSLETHITLTATWPDDSEMLQLRLFPPSPIEAAVEDFVEDTQAMMERGGVDSVTLSTPGMQPVTLRRDDAPEALGAAAN